MSQPLCDHAAFYLGDVLGELCREIVDAHDHGVGIEAQFLPELVPVATGDVSETIFAPQLHGELDALYIDVPVGQNARDVIERGKSDTGLSGDEQCVVLGVRVGSGNEPVVGNGVEKSAHILRWVRGVGPEDFDDVPDARPALALVFAGGRNSPGLAKILLMDASEP